MPLNGTPVTVSTVELRKLIGTRVRYRTTIWNNISGVVEDVMRRQVCLDGDYVPFNRILEMVIWEPPKPVE